VLERAGFTLIGEAADGQLALDMAIAGRPDLVLLDVQLPDMSGFDVATRLRDVGGASSNIILVSSREATAYGERIGRCGAVGFIWKGDLSVASLSELVGALE
jgi:DNA-binding NarL/FixJ family response regulator